VSPPHQTNHRAEAIQERVGAGRSDAEQTEDPSQDAQRQDAREEHENKPDDRPEEEFELEDEESETCGREEGAQEDPDHPFQQAFHAEREYRAVTVDVSTGIFRFRIDFGPESAMSDDDLPWPPLLGADTEIQQLVDTAGATTSIGRQAVLSTNPAADRAIRWNGQ
jgi:hypothetical protein